MSISIKGSFSIFRIRTNKTVIEGTTYYINELNQKNLQIMKTSISYLKNTQNK